MTGRPKASSDAFPVVGIGASAGGLDAFRKLFSGLPADSGMAFVVIQHLDPTHESMMAELLARDTPVRVVQASDGMPIEPNLAYVIPPQAFLAVEDGVLRLSEPLERRGARLPFDFFLHSLARAYRERAVCVILSGTGGDGSVGLKTISENGGLVIAQDPGDAAYDGMPRSAIATGAVNMVLPAAEIPRALVSYARHPYLTEALATRPPDGEADRALEEIIALLRTRTSNDFSHYRTSTLLRRIRRRMAIAGIAEIADYLALLRRSRGEAEQLAKDFLIHVTRFFRDPSAYEALAKTVVHQLVLQNQGDAPIRVWVPGCSSGEEAYSLAILFFEEFAAQGRTGKLLVFASDISEHAVTAGRNGLYPDSITADVSPERLQRFFIHEERGYRVSRELRDALVFTVQDVLSDPPFSRLDLISCRNLLIYLEPEEQQKLLPLFHFALRENGFLFIGAAESVGRQTDRFEQISPSMPIYRATESNRPRERGSATDIGARARALWPMVSAQAAPRRADTAEFARRLLLESLAPAAVLIDRNYRTLFFSGPTDRYLRVASGVPNQSVLPMLREGLASKFRAVIQRASQNRGVATEHGAQVRRNGDTASVSISAKWARREDEELFLVSFVDEPERPAVETAQTPEEASRIAELDQELENTRQELESTIQELETANQKLSAINEEAVSINEEYLSTNEELETSKEEMQSLNEELTTLNTQLQESLERQRHTADDLQNILNSSDAATVFLDEEFKIRFFTPSAASHFNMIASDIGRPLADLANPFPDIDLVGDARTALAQLDTVKREIRSRSGAWYTCRTSPYRSDNRIKGVVISLSDISAIKAFEQEVQSARDLAEAIIDTVNAPLIVLDEAMRVVLASQSFYRYFRASPDDTIGHALTDTDAHHLDVPALHAFLGRLRARNGRPGMARSRSIFRIPAGVA